MFRWLTQNFLADNLISETELGTPFEIGHNIFHINATLRLKNSFIIRSYSEDPKMPDATSIKSLDDWVLTGTSLKGAIRARAERIVHTLGKRESIITELFGNVDGKDRSKNAKKGKIRVKEIALPKFIAELQTQIKIDRFTGGTIPTALFDSMPLFANPDEKVENIHILVQNCSPAEAGLLLLVLKDLWTGDLTVGGEKSVGRGVFEGIRAIIEWNGERVTIEKDLTIHPPEKKNMLQDWVGALNSEN